MASSKARSGRRPASANGSRSAGGPASRSSRTAAAVSATPTSHRAGKPAVKAEELEPEPLEDEIVEPADAEPERTRPAGQPLWLQIVSFALAILGLGISAYETYAHFHGSHLAGCPAGGNGAFNCTAVITSPQSMVFGVIPVAVLGLAFYVAAVPLFSPWAWRAKRRELDLVRLGSVIAGMGFVVYLIYAELYQIGDICEYCTGVHIVTFLLFCITVFSAAIWGLSAKRE
jgi:uncharacterized membrane protein